MKEKWMLRSLDNWPLTELTRAVSRLPLVKDAQQFSAQSERKRAD